MKSRRLTYRKLEAADAPRVAEFAGDWDIARMTARIPFPYTAAMAATWIAEIPDDEYVRAIVLDGQLIGSTGYIEDENKTAEIGYWIGRPWWGRGYATEAADALVHHCFTRKRFPRLTCCHFVDNAASARVIAKLGFKPTGTCTAYSDARKREIETIRYELKRPILPAFRKRAAQVEL